MRMLIFIKAGHGSCYFLSGRTLRSEQQGILSPEESAQVNSEPEDESLGVSVNEDSSQSTLYTSLTPEWYDIGHNKRSNHLHESGYNMEDEDTETQPTAPHQQNIPHYTGRTVGNRTPIPRGPRTHGLRPRGNPSTFNYEWDEGRKRSWLEIHEPTQHLPQQALVDYYDPFKSRALWGHVDVRLVHESIEITCPEIAAVGSG
jgi:hypothetical protein